MGGITKIEWADCVINPIQDVIKGKSGRAWVRSKKLWRFDDGTQMVHVGKKAAGRILDGRTWDETPR